MCTIIRKNGILFCETHGKELVDRATLESSGIALENPPLGDLFCPMSGQGALGQQPDTDEFFEGR